ncbi:MAG TPA: GTP-binding protein [Alphaproteobacteria bacterium]|jgi:flagellar biosynthesis protein FlhF|nr:GTP-binding protein [Alphaproteobacteria bacterium]
MRLKSFSAPTMAQAMALVRREMGESAVIVSSTSATRDGLVHVTAAVDAQETGNASLAAVAPSPSASDSIATVMRALHDHGAPIGVVDRLFDRLVDGDQPDPAAALAAGLDRLFRFAPLALASVAPARADRAVRPVMLVGPPGSGKTATAAKLATGAIMHRAPVELVSCDPVRAGAADQLAAFAAILEVPLRTAAGASALAEIVARAAPGALLLIDTAAVNPFAARDMAALAELAAAAKAEMVVALAAGGDALESADIAAAFAALGATRLVATRLDIARRYGALLAAASAPLAFAGAGVAASIAHGLLSLDAPTLARLLLDRDAALAGAPVLEAAQ